MNTETPDEDSIEWYPEPDPDEMTDGKTRSRLEELGYTINNHGMIQGLDRPETAEESLLINYLCDEWDYGFVEFGGKP